MRIVDALCRCSVTQGPCAETVRTAAAQARPNSLVRSLHCAPLVFVPCPRVHLRLIHVQHIGPSVLCAPRLCATVPAELDRPIWTTLDTSVMEGCRQHATLQCPQPTLSALSGVAGLSQPLPPSRARWAAHELEQLCANARHHLLRCLCNHWCCSGHSCYCPALGSPWDPLRAWTSIPAQCANATLTPYRPLD